VVWVALAGGAALVARPADVTRRLVWIDFSQRGPTRHEEQEGALRAKYAQHAWWIEAFMNDEPVDRMVAHFANGGAPIVVRAIDYHDEWSARYAPRLAERLDAELLATFPSPFGDIPGCTLHTYNGWTDRYYLVRGVKRP